MFDFDWLNDFDGLDIGLAGAMSEEMTDAEMKKRFIDETFPEKNDDESDLM